MEKTMNKKQREKVCEHERALLIELVDDCPGAYMPVNYRGHFAITGDEPRQLDIVLDLIESARVSGFREVSNLLREAVWANDCLYWHHLEARPGDLMVKGEAAE